MFKYVYGLFMHISFKFDIQPLSINKAFRAIKRGKFAVNIKSQEYRNYETIIENNLDFELLAMLNNAFDKSRHIIQCRIIWFTPDFFTKKKELSLTCGDVDNIVKPLWDSILQHTPNLNDAFIKNANLFQFPGEKHSVEIHFHLEEIEKYLQLIR